MKLQVALMLSAFYASPNLALAQTAQQTSDQNMRNANEVAARQQQERAAQEMRRMNQQNGTSQYTGPTGSYSPGSGEVRGGYQWSTK